MEGREKEPRIVVDTNIIISALLKDNSTNSHLIKSKLFCIYFPDYGLKEIEKYKSYIKAKRVRKSQSLFFEFAEKYILEEVRIAHLTYTEKKWKRHMRL
ncbi:MAG: PIN domain-containing protein [Methanothrix sp.]|nr:PIN domain-containing protein [Methanothrix sp.]